MSALVSPEILAEVLTVLQQQGELAAKKLLMKRGECTPLEAREIVKGLQPHDPLPLVPSLLKSLPNWVTFESKDNKAPKISGTYSNAKSDDPATWVTYEVACKNIAEGKGYQGLGFVTDGANSNNLVGFDLDGCRNPETGELTPWATRVLSSLGPTYAEVTISGTGLRAWVITSLGKSIKFKMGATPLYYGKNQVLEIFGDGLYFTISGNRLPSSPSEILTLDAARMGEVLAIAHSLAVEAPKPAKPMKGAYAPEPDEGFRNLFEEIGWTPLIDRMNKMVDNRFHNLTVDAGVMSYCPMPGHQPRSTGMKYTPCFGAMKDEPSVVHCFGCDFSGDMVKAVFEFDAGEDGGRIQHKNMYECARVICAEYGRNFHDFFPEKKEKPEPEVDFAGMAGENEPEDVMSEAELEAEYEKPFPVIPLPPQAGPYWDDAVLYGRLGDITRKASEYNEAHPAGIYLDLIVSIGNCIGRTAYFRVNHTAHYTNEFLVRVGPTSQGRKGGGRDTVDAIMSLVDFDWVASRTMSGFGSGEAVIDQIRDSSIQSVRDRKGNGFKTLVVPGVPDKRLCVRAGEIAGTFEVASRDGSLMSVILRDGWDSKMLRNTVKGKTDGISNSLVCKEPHMSVSGDCTKEELIAKIPDNSAENGFGNRFIWCYVHRTKLCPLGGPDIDWGEDAAYLHKVITFARELKYVGLSRAAERMWARMYQELSQGTAPGLAGKMTARAAAHIRRLALIFAVVDMSSQVESCHLRAAKDLWDYCQQSAEYIFSGITKDQARIVRFVEKTGATTPRQILDEAFHRHQKVAWVRAQVDDLVRLGYLLRDGDKVTKK